MDIRNKIKCIQRIKIISMGNTEVGKSCLIKRYCEKRFIGKYQPTIGIDYGLTKITLDDKEMGVNIFDMGGHPIFYEVRNEFYQDVHGAMLTYDVSDRSSFQALNTWLQEMIHELGEQSAIENIVFVVCGNKCDKQRAVDEADGRLWSDLHGFPYFETSALTGDGVADMFESLLRNILKMLEGNGCRVALCSAPGYTREQLEAVHKLRWATDEYDKLGLQPGATKDEINRAYRKLAVLLHPDKSVAPGSEEAFKTLVATRTSLLRYA
ncbi:dnaJ homolog subfamily C member 27-like [Tachypleus tridentatus]|uniref:dnaJ homolog subfamily C member 27-like n=1 Tax=Tachypleus tridentatus TaxID=6853 RepID=UPI003FD62AE5